MNIKDNAFFFKISLNEFFSDYENRKSKNLRNRYNSNNSFELKRNKKKNKSIIRIYSENNINHFRNKKKIINNKTKNDNFEFNIDNYNNLSFKLDSYDWLFKDSVNVKSNKKDETLSNKMFKYIELLANSSNENYITILNNFIKNSKYKYKPITDEEKNINLSKYIDSNLFSKCWKYPFNKIQKKESNDLIDLNDKNILLSEKKIINDLKENEKKNSYFENSKENNIFPSKRSSHTCNIVRNKIFLFGGWNGKKALNDLYIYDIERNKWFLVNYEKAKNYFEKLKELLKNIKKSKYNTEFHIYKKYKKQKNRITQLKNIKKKQSKLNKTLENMNNISKYINTTKEYMNNTSENINSTKEIMNNTSEYINITSEYINSTSDNINSTSENMNKSSEMDSEIESEIVSEIDKISNISTLNKLNLNDSLENLKNENNKKKLFKKKLIKNNKNMKSIDSSFFYSKKKLLINILNSINEDDMSLQFKYPCPRNNHASCCIDEIIFFFGGHDSKKWLNDMFILNVSGTNYSLKFSKMIKTIKKFNENEDILRENILKNNNFYSDLNYLYLHYSELNYSDITDTNLTNSYSDCSSSCCVTNDENINTLQKKKNIQNMSTYNKDTLTKSHNYIYFIEIKKKADTDYWPIERACHSLNVIENKLYLFGGCNENICLNNIEVFDIYQRKWNILNSVLGTIPCSRCDHSTTTIKNNLYIYGGRSFDGYLNDLFEFNTKKLIWTEIKFKNYNFPKLAGHTICYIYDNFFLFGGCNENKILNNVYIINKKKKKCFY